MAQTLNVTQNSLNPSSVAFELLHQLRSCKQWIINPRRKNGIIIYKPYHAEFAGPGAVIGGLFDRDVVAIFPVGKLSLIQAHDCEERKRSYLIRRQWIRLFTKILENPDPIERAQVILNQFEHWFDIETAHQVSNDAFARLIGVLPQTIAQVRHNEERFDLL
jgi:hypothetical protein